MNSPGGVGGRLVGIVLICQPSFGCTRCSASTSGLDWSFLELPKRHDAVRKDRFDSQLTAER